MGWSSDGKESGSDGKENAKDGGVDGGLLIDQEIFLEQEIEEIFIF